VVRLPAKKFTVLVIPEGSHRVRRFGLKRSALNWALFGLLAFCMGLGGLLFDYARTHLDRTEFSRLKAENRSQREELDSLVAKLEDLRKEMVILAQNDAKVRVMAKLSRPKGDSLSGIGGPGEEDIGEEYSQLQETIDSLRRQIDLQRESQEEVRGFLNDQRSLLAAKPSGWPVRGWTSSGFGMRRDPFTGRRKMHEGYDIAARTGTPVTATADGIVSQSKTVPGYGKMVVIDHGYGYRTYYGHNSKNFVKVGQRVKRGDKIAAVGNTGRSTGSHVHYEVRLNGVPVSPKKYL